MKKKKRFSKIEFSKKLLITLIIISSFFTLLSYILAFLGKDTVENLSIEITRVLWSIDGIGVLAYSALNGSRAWSLNKYVNNSQQNEITEEVYGGENK